MESESFKPHNLKPLNAADYNIHFESSSAHSFWKATCKCIRKKDNKAFRGIVIPDLDYYNACFEFFDYVSPFENWNFLRCFGYIEKSPSDQEDALQNPVIVFEEFKCTLAQYIIESDLTKDEFEDLVKTLIDAIKFLTRDLGSIFPRINPDLIAVIKPKSGKAIFKLIDMFFIKNSLPSLPFEETKWFAPELYTAIVENSGKIPDISHMDLAKSMLFSAGLVLLYLNSRSNFQEKRKNAKSGEDLKKVWPQEHSILDLNIEKLKIKYSYTRDDYIIILINGMIQYDPNERHDIDSIRGLISNEPVAIHMGDEDVSFTSMENKGIESDNMFKSSHINPTYVVDQNPISNGTQNVNSPITLPNLSKNSNFAQYEEDPHLLATNRFILIEGKTYFKLCKDKNTNTIYSCLNYFIGDIKPKDDIYIKQLKGLSKLENDHLLKFFGYFFKDETTKNEIIILFENHSGVIDEVKGMSNPLTKDQTLLLACCIVEALYTMYTQSHFLPLYLTPNNIVAIQNNEKVTYKLAFLKNQDPIPPEDLVWVSPEVFMNETIKDRAKSLIYSFALVLLYLVNRDIATSYRTSIKDKGQLKAGETDRVPRAVLAFREKLRIDTSAVIDGKFDSLMVNSIEFNPMHRADLTAWNFEVNSFYKYLATVNLTEEKKNGPVVEGGLSNGAQAPLVDKDKKKKKRSFFACCAKTK